MEIPQLDGWQSGMAKDRYGDSVVTYTRKIKPGLIHKIFTNTKDEWCTLGVSVNGRQYDLSFQPMTLALAEKYMLESHNCFIQRVRSKKRWLASIDITTGETYTKWER